MRDLDRFVTADTTVVADASYASMWVAGELTARKPGSRFLSPRGLAGLGWGLPLAIGTKLAAPSSPVVAVVGDGGFAHSWAELETLVRHKIALTVIVLNNGVLGFQKDAERVKFGAYTSACHFARADSWRGTGLDATLAHRRRDRPRRLSAVVPLRYQAAADPVGLTAIGSIFPPAACVMRARPACFRDDLLCQAFLSPPPSPNVCHSMKWRPSRAGSGPAAIRRAGSRSWRSRMARASTASRSLPPTRCRTTRPRSCSSRPAAR